MMPFQDMLSPELIIAAYRGGYFPMPDPDTGEILWYNPDPRTIIPLDQFHISKSLRRTARQSGYKITFDQDFFNVVEGCADRNPTWISAEIKSAYTRLFELGFGHSIEIWNETGDLVGGLYGLTQGAVFNAESMFSREVDASKIALWALTKLMQECGMTLLEVQFMTPHLKSLGAQEIPKEQYLSRLAVCIRSEHLFTAPQGFYNIL
jgi:leucyl/phenylalanyl-tRNA--protein transferase